MFFIGVLSTPLPYLVIAVFYFIGFVTGMFKGNADNEPIKPIQVKNIQVEPMSPGIEKSSGAFHFHQYHFHKKVDNYAIVSVQPTPVGQHEKLIYIVHEIKIPYSSTSEYNFCRPPPSRS